MFGVYEWWTVTKDDPGETTIVPLPARTYFWVYHVRSSHGISLEDAKVESDVVVGTKTIGFKVQKPGPPNEIVLVSNAPIYLEEQPDWKIKLTAKGIPRGIRLPFGSPASLTLKDSKQIMGEEGLYCRIRVDL